MHLERTDACLNVKAGAAGLAGAVASLHARTVFRRQDNCCSKFNKRGFKASTFSPTCAGHRSSKQVRGGLCPHTGAPSQGGVECVQRISNSRMCTHRSQAEMLERVHEIALVIRFL